MSKNPKVLLRDLYVELAKQLQQVAKFNEIAAMFYRFGIIDEPDRPWPTYDGSKYDYALEKLSAARSPVPLLEALPEIVYDSVNGIDDHPIDCNRIVWLMKQMGYVRIEEQGDPEFPPMIDYKPPENLSVFTQERPSKTMPQTTKRVDIDGLPRSLAELLDELNDNLARSNPNACALLIRQILTRSAAIVLKKAGKASLLVTKDGSDAELSQILAECQREFSIPSQVMSRVRSAKWIADSANHSYRVRIVGSDVETAVTGMRLLLEELGLVG